MLVPEAESAGFVVELNCQVLLYENIEDPIDGLAGSATGENVGCVVLVRVAKTVLLLSKMPFEIW